MPQPSTAAYSFAAGRPDGALLQGRRAAADVKPVARAPDDHPLGQTAAGPAPRAAPPARGPLIQLATRCASIDDFVERFARFATDTSLVMPASGNVAVGTEGQFVIRLKDHSLVMRGRCRVAEVKAGVGADGRPARPGQVVMRVQLMEMDPASREVHRRLLAHEKPRAEPPRPPLPKPPPAPFATAPTVIAVPAPPPPGRASGRAPWPVAAPVPVPVPAPVPVPVPVPLSVPEAATAGPAPGGAVRTPGAPDTLPANPLSDLEADDLASFIECTLFEAEEFAPADQTARVARVLPVEGPAEPAGKIAPAAPPARSRYRGALADAAPYALCTLIGVVAGIALRNSPPSVPRPRSAMAAPRPPAPPAPAAAAPAPAAPGLAPAPVAAPSVRAPATASAPAGDRPHAPGACLASITSEPDGAEVFWSGHRLGRSPLERAPVPCGAGSLVLKHDRYSPVTKSMNVEPGRRAVVDERLHRPPGTLIVSSSPPHAHITVNDQPAGPAPSHLNVWRFEHVHVRASLPGYQPWSKTIYLKDAVTKLNAPLASASRPDARAGAHPTMQR